VSGTASPTEVQAILKDRAAVVEKLHGMGYSDAAANFLADTDLGAEVALRTGASIKEIVDGLAAISIAYLNKEAGIPFAALDRDPS